MSVYDFCRLAVRQQDMVQDTHAIFIVHAQSRRVLLVIVPTSENDLRLVDRYKIFHPIPVKTDDGSRVIGKPVGAVAVEPSALIK